MSVCVCVCLASHSSGPIEVIIIKLDTVTASDMTMHHVFHYIALTFIQGHTDLNHDNSKCPIISETVQAIPMRFAVKMLRVKVPGPCSSLKVTIAAQRVSDGLEKITVLYSLCFFCF